MILKTNKYLCQIPLSLAMLQAACCSNLSSIGPWVEEKSGKQQLDLLLLATTTGTIFLSTLRSGHSLVYELHLCIKTPLTCSWLPCCIRERYLETIRVKSFVMPRNKRMPSKRQSTCLINLHKYMPILWQRDILFEQAPVVCP